MEAMVTVMVVAIRIQNIMNMGGRPCFRAGVETVGENDTIGVDMDKVVKDTAGEATMGMAKQKYPLRTDWYPLW